MKRIFYLVGFFILVVGLSYITQQFLMGRQFALTTAPAGSDEIQDAIASGKLTSLGSVAVPGSGSHILLKKDGTSVLLNGLGTNLEPYNGKMVEVEGRPSKTASGKDLIQVLRVRELTPEETAAAQSVSKVWSTYEDSVLGMKFLKRDSWNLSNTAGITTITIPAEQPICTAPPCVPVKDDTITIEKLNNAKDAPLASFVGDAKLTSHNLIGPKKLNGYELQNSATGVIVVGVAREKSVFRLTYTPGVFRAADASANDFHSLLNSFEFLSISTI